MGARIHVDGGAGQHAHLADPVKGARFDGGEAHNQIDNEKRYNRHQAQCEKVKRAFFFDTLVEFFQPFSKAILHRVMEQKAGGEKRQGSAR